MGFFKRATREAADYNDPPLDDAALPKPEATSPPDQTRAMPMEVDPAPSAPGAEPTIRPLAEGEERLLNTIQRPDGERNEIYLVHRRPSDDETMGTGEPINFVAIIRSTDQDPNDTSPPFAWQCGPDERTIYIRVAEAAVNAPPPPGGSATLDPDVQWFVDRIREQNPGPSPMEEVQNWAHLYATACQEVLAAANACIEPANKAINAQEMLTNRPYEYRNTPEGFFTGIIERATQEFGPAYQSFEQACANARETAGKLLAAGRDPLQAEMVLAMQADEPTLNTVATVRSILRTHYGPTPAAFIQGVQESNALMQANSDEDGNIYTPLPSAQPEERTCPWCAETIKAAAVICRFCGRDVQLQPNAG